MEKEQAYKLLNESDDGECFKDFSESLKKDAELARIAVDKKPGNIRHISKTLLDNREFMLDLIARTNFLENTGFLSMIPAHYRSDKDIVLGILSTWDSSSLKHASDELRNDPDVVWCAMFKNGILWSPLAYEFAGKEILKDTDFLKKCVAELKSYRASHRQELIQSIKNWHKLALATEKGKDAGKIEEIKIKLKKLKKEMKEASNSYYREKASKELADIISSISDLGDNASLLKLLVEVDYLQNDYECKTRGKSTSVISKKLLEDEKFASSIMKVTEGEVLEKLPEKYRNNINFVKENIGEKTKASSLHSSLRENKEFLLELTHSVRIFKFKEFPIEKLWTDKDFVLSVVKINGLYLENAVDHLKKDKEIVFAALESYPYSVIYADPEFHKDREYMRLAMSSENSAAAECLREPLLSDLQFLLESISKIKKKKQSGLSNLTRSLMRTVPLTLRSNKELVIPCLELNGWAIESVPEEIKYDKDVLKAAFKSGAAAYKELDLKKLQTLYTKPELKEILKSDFYLNEILNAK